MISDKESYNLQLSMLNDSYKIVNTNLADLTEKVNNISTDAKVDAISEGNTSINALSDVNTTGAVSGQILKYDSTISKWVVGNETDTTYSAGFGITIDTTSNEISINQGAAFNLTNLTSTTQTLGDISTKVATTEFVRDAISNLVNSAPGTLDTLNELALALNNDDDFSVTMTTLIGTKLDTSEFSNKFVTQIGNTSINALSDVNTTGAALGNILKYDFTNSKWVVGNEITVSLDRSVQIFNGVGSNTVFNYQNNGSNFINGTSNEISSTAGRIYLDAGGTGPNSGVRIKNTGIPLTMDTIFNYNNSGGNYIRGSENNIDSFTSGLFLNAFGSDGVIKMNADGTGTDSGVQIVNGVGSNTIFNYQNNGSNFINGTSNEISSTAGGIYLDTYGTGQTDSGVRIKNRTATGTSFSDTVFNYANIGANYIRGENFDVDVLAILLNGTNNGVEIKNGGGFNSTFFNFGNNGENYLTGINFYINSTSLIELKATGGSENSGVQIVNGGSINKTIFNYQNNGSNFINGTTNTISSTAGGIYLDADGTGTNSGVQIVNGVGYATVFNYQNNGSNFINGDTTFSNDIYIQKITTNLDCEVGGNLKIAGALELAQGYGNSGDFLVSQGIDSATGAPKAAIWSNVVGNSKVYCHIGVSNFLVAGINPVTAAVYNHGELGPAMSSGGLFEYWDNLNAITSGQSPAPTQTAPFTAPRDGIYAVHFTTTTKCPYNYYSNQSRSTVRLVRIFTSNTMPPIRTELTVAQTRQEEIGYGPANGDGTHDHRVHSMSAIVSLVEGEGFGVRYFTRFAASAIDQDNTLTALVVHNVD